MLKIFIVLINVQFDIYTISFSLKFLFRPSENTNIRGLNPQVNFYFLKKEKLFDFDKFYEKLDYFLGYSFPSFLPTSSYHIGGRT